MKSWKLFPSVLVAGVILIAVALVADAQYDIRTVNDSAFSEKQRPDVIFDHDSHNEAAEIFECNICHHVVEDGETLPDVDSVGMECSECHMSEADDSSMDLIRAYHLQCRGCHLEEKSGPIYCAECHSGSSGTE